MQKKILLVLLFALIIAVFAIQNANQVLIKIFQWDFEISLVFIVLGEIAFGALIMALVTSFTQLKLRKKIKKLQKENEQLTNEIEQLGEEYRKKIEVEVANDNPENTNLTDYETDNFSGQDKLI